MSPRNRAALVLSAVFAVQASAYYGFARRTESIGSVTALAEFPRAVGDWQLASEKAITADEREVLRADDYLVRTYATGSVKSANLFVAYFRSQRAGRTPHSPKNCLPGSGWSWSVADTIQVPIAGRVDPIDVNRYVVAKGDEHAVVLYWYQSHGRVVASEYKAAFFTAWDALRYNRTDTTFVRVVAPDTESGANFIQACFNELGRYN